MKHLVIGMGEVGTAIQKIFDCDWIDLENDHYDHYENIQYQCMHICFGYDEKFINSVAYYQQEYSPEFTVIHSTVPVGVSRHLNAINSPIRGIHPNLYEGIMTFEKFIGGEQASLVADEFRKHGLKVILCDKQETTELGKLLDTEYYRACIEFTHRAKELCSKHEVPFAEVYRDFNRTYNEGYTKLGHPEFVRPVLQPIMTKIGGHCVTENSKLI